MFYPHNLLPLESDRLIFKPFKLDELEFIHKFRNLPGVNFESQDETLEETKYWLEREVESYEKEGIGHVGLYLKKTGDFIGRSGLRTIDIVEGKEGEKDQWFWYGEVPKEAVSKKAIEVGYVLKPDYRNKGYITEATLTLCNKAFENNLSNQILAATLEDNIPSKKVLEKCGFKRTGEVSGLGMDLIGYALQRK